MKHLAIRLSAEYRNQRDYGCLSLCLSVRLFICPTVCLSESPNIRMSITMSSEGSHITLPKTHLSRSLPPQGLRSHIFHSFVQSPLSSSMSLLNPLPFLLQRQHASLSLSFHPPPPLPFRSQQWGAGGVLLCWWEGNLILNQIFQVDYYFRIVMVIHYDYILFCLSYFGSKCFFSMIRIPICCKSSKPFITFSE